MIKFHPDKCKVLTLCFLEKIERPYAFLYEPHGTILQHVFEEKGLDMHVDDQLCFHAHVDDKISKAKPLLGLIRHSFICLSGNIMLPLHKGLVRHYLEYGGVLWNARASRAQLRAVEKVQMRALDMVDGMDGKTYEEQASKLTTLSYRRC